MNEGYLFATVGVTDLRVPVRAANGGLLLVAINRNVRIFHQTLLDKRNEFKVVGRAPGVLLENPLRDGRFEEGGVFIEGRNKDSQAERLEPLRDEAGRILLVAAKVRDVAERLQRPPIVRLVGATIFSTHRDNEPKEPIAAAELLGQWLAAECGLQFTSENLDIPRDIRAGLIHVAILARGSQRTDGGEAREQPVKRAIVNHVSSVVRAAAALKPDLDAWLALGGGIPSIKGIVEGAAELHFDGRTLDCEVPEGRDPAKEYPIDRRELPLAAHDALRIRRDALKLLRTGNFAGAAAVATAAEGDPSERSWVRRVCAWHHWVQGGVAWADIESGLRDDCGDLTDPVDNTLRTLFGSIDGKAPAYEKPLRAAIRAESALAMKQYVEAAVWTVTLYDALLMAHIGKLPFVASGPTVKPSVFVKTAPPESLTQPIPTQKSVKGKNHSVKGKQVMFDPCLEPDPNGGSGEWKVKTGGIWNVRWEDAISQAPLKTLRLALYHRSSGHTPANLRHIIIHRASSQDDLASVPSVFVAARLWMPVDPDLQLGDHILASPIVAGALESTDYADAGTQFKKFIACLDALVLGLPVK